VATAAPVVVAIVTPAAYGVAVALAVVTGVFWTGRRIPQEPGPAPSSRQSGAARPAA
jgi:hypothetical protein